MKNFQKLIAVSMLAISITSCQKTPEASFTTDKSEYVAGETINLTNTTLNGKTYKWTFPDGQTGSSESYAFETDDNDPAGTLTFRLEAFSSNGKKSDEVSKSVNIKAAEGDVVFWQQAGSGYGTTVVSLNSVTSNITTEYTSSPDCGASGCAVFNGLKVGTYNYAATDGGTNWSGTLTVTKNTCLKLKLN